MPDEKIADLIERVERLEGPDRELDCDIAVHFLGGEIKWRSERFTGDQYPVRRYASTDHIGGFGTAPVEPVTASLDAVLSLVERVRPGTTWFADASYPELGIDWTLFPNGEGPGIRATAKTAPLAVLSALLRSIQQGA